ncbi:MAG: hypothetical protein H7A46_10630 [Verrucomicrobiales bacterium]|nr:hypothetical protein [Verrucomicrobiales bacterium]
MEEFLGATRNDEVERSLWNRLRLQPDLPFDLDAVLDQLAVIYDGEPSGFVAHAHWCATGDYRLRARSFLRDRRGRSLSNS